MKKIVPWLILFFLSIELIQAQEDAARYLDQVGKKFADLKDYTVDGNVHFDIEALKAPDMQAKLYYKAPDKIKVESKGIFFFPREGGYFNPAMFRKEDFEVRLLNHLIYNGRNAVKLSLTPKDIKRGRQGFVLTIDTDQNLITEIDTSPFAGREIKVVIDYGRFDHFELPKRIEVRLDIPSIEANGINEIDPFVQRARRIKGRIEITYSNYKVNSNLSDEIFTKTESRQPK